MTCIACIGFSKALQRTSLTRLMKPLGYLEYDTGVGLWVVWVQWCGRRYRWDGAWRRREDHCPPIFSGSTRYVACSFG